MITLNDSLLNPKNWFLTGKEKARYYAKRKYYGENLDRALVDIDHGADTTGSKLANLEIDKKYNRITNHEFEKNRADLLNEPFVTVVKVHMDGTKPSDGYFELDWNDVFIKTLIEAGYVADTQELIIKQWFDELCSNIARENGAIFPNELEEFKHKTARRVKSEDGKIEVL